MVASHLYFAVLGLWVCLGGAVAKKKPVKDALWDALHDVSPGKHGLPHYLEEMNATTSKKGIFVHPLILEELALPTVLFTPLGQKADAADDALDKYEAGLAVPTQTKQEYADRWGYHNVIYKVPQAH